MCSVKETAIELISKLPEDCTLEDIQYELYFKAKIEKGLQDVQGGNILTEEEMDKEIAKW